MENKFDRKLLMAYLFGELAEQSSKEIDLRLGSDNQLASDLALLLEEGIETEKAKDVQKLLVCNGFLLTDEQIRDYCAGKATTAVCDQVELRMQREEKFGEKVDLFWILQEALCANQEISEEAIRNYCLGTASDAICNQIEEKMIQDKEFAEKVDFFWMLKEGGQVAAVKAKPVSEAIDVVEGSNPKDGKIVRFNLVRLVAAASILLILSFSVWWTMQPTTSELIYNEQFAEAATSQISEEIDQLLARMPNGFGGVADLENLQKAMDFYEEKNYKEAIPLLQKYRNSYDSTFQQESQFYLAMAYLQTQKTKEAADLLQPLSKLTDFALKSDVYWFLAGAYLKQNKEKEAKEILQGLSSDSAYGEKSKAILKELD